MSKFNPGQSAKVGGRPREALNKTTLASYSLLDGETGALTCKVVELSRNGNPVAMPLCLERLLPPPKDRPIKIPVPKVEGREG
jgi:hypothetical protein